MELNGQIPQSFKVQWLNTTLKFIKDDTQLVKDYQQMPYSHVEYLHNLIWQRKNNVGFGFKSLYSPVWEAMKIYSVKYQFKIVVEKSDDGMSGNLIMQKIPKTGQSAKTLIDEKKEINNKIIPNSEVPKKTQTVAVKKQPEPQKFKKVKTKKLPKGLKMFIDNQKILDSLSPLFIKKMFNSILDFLMDKLSASKIFTDLAPVESRFLENFLSIYERRNDLEVMLSPACNEILTEISNCFEDFSETCCLDITCVGVRSNTNKREVKYTKVPVFPNKKKTKPKLKENSIQTKTKTVPPNDDTKQVVNIPSINKEEYNMTEPLSKITISFSNEGTKRTVDIPSTRIEQKSPKMKIQQDMTVPINNVKTARLKENSIKTKTTIIPHNDDTTKLENIPSIYKQEYNMTTKENVSKETKKYNSQNKTLQNKIVVEDKYANSEPIDKVIKTKDNNIIETSSSIKKPNDFKPKTNTYLKDTSINKSILLPKKSINFTKEGTSSTDTPYIKVEKKTPNMKILRDMTVPLNSDKAERMMQLMGWQGGALGLRGDGITEPIIPILNFKKNGLGHVAVKKDSNKETKNYIRSEFMNKILKMIDNNIKVSVIKLQNKLNKRENRFWELTIKLINDRVDVDAEFEKRLEIKDKMLSNKDIMFNIELEDENRKIIITKTSKKEMKVNKNTSKDTNAEENDTNANKTSKATFKTIVLKSILELIKSADKEKVIQFDKDLKLKHIRYSNTMILLINERQYVKQKNSRVVAELGSKVLEAIGDIVLSVSIYESERYIVIRKKHPKSNDNQKNIKTVVNKAESYENNNSAFDNVRSYLPTQKKYKLLNALYKYEIDFTEEFKENQWYNTVDKSLLETAKTVILKNKIMRIIQ